MITTEKLPDEPIIVQTYVGSYNVAAEGHAVVAEVRALLEKQSEPMYLILDVSQASFNLDDILAGASIITRDTNALLRDPMIRETLVVSSSGLVKLSAKGLNTATFGNVSVKVFDSLEQALAYCHG